MLESYLEQSTQVSKPAKMWVDEGGEFYNKRLTQYLKKEGIVRYSTYGEHKSCIVERFNRTLKTWMWKRFTAEQTRRWVDMLPKLISEYNHKEHAGIGRRPIEVVQGMKPLLKVEKSVRRMPAFELGDKVRISRVKRVFEKGYLPNWSYEVFTVVGRRIPYDGDPVTYTLEDGLGERIKGSFYEEEMQKAKYGEIQLVEKVLEQRGGVQLDQVGRAQ